MGIALIEGNKIHRVATGVSSATTNVTSGSVDLKDSDHVTFVAQLGAATATGTFTLTFQHSNSATTGWASTNAAASFSATGNAGKGLLVVEAVRPVKRYGRVVLSRPGGALQSIIAIEGGVNRAPVTQPSTVLASDFTLHPVT